MYKTCKDNQKVQLH